MREEHVKFWPKMPAETLEMSVWDCLETATGRRQDPLHCLTLATIDADMMPQQRCVTIRECNVARREIGFNIDHRSAKAAELRRHPFGGLHGYDSARRLQIRLSGQVRLHHQDDIAALAWLSSQRMARLTYASAVAPGTVLETQEQDGAPTQMPDRQAEVTAYHHFVAVQFKVQVMDVYVLKAGGHVRWRFEYHSGWRALRLAP